MNGEHAAERILIVEDEPLNSELLKCILERKYSTAVAADGKEAINMARQERFDLILLDALLPDMDGFVVCEALMADPRTAGVPVIFVTASSEAVVQSRAMSAGAVDFITKPYSPARVLERIRYQLTRQGGELSEPSVH